MQGSNAVVLLSGGLDSATALALAMADGFTPYALSFRYGQRHSSEIEAAARVAAVAGVTRHVVVDIDLRVFGGSALTDDIDVPKRAAEAGESGAARGCKRHLVRALPGSEEAVPAKGLEGMREEEEATRLGDKLEVRVR